MNEKEMIKTIDKIKKIEKVMKEKEKVVASLKSELKAEMDKEEVEKLEVGIYKMSYVSVSRENFNKKKFKEDKPKLYDKYVTCNSHKRFAIY